MHVNQQQTTWRWKKYTRAEKPWVNNLLGPINAVN